MPLRMAPDAGDLPETKDVRPDGFEAEGPFAEKFTILSYFDPRVDAACRKKATSTVVAPDGRPIREDLDRDRYFAEVIKAQLTGWETIAPPSAVAKLSAEEKKRRVYEKNGLDWWTYIPENVARLPWDARAFLFDEIQRCGGLITTRTLIVKTATGETLDFRRPYAGMDEGLAQELPVGGRERVLPDAGTGAPDAGSRRGKDTAPAE